jgi:polyhydroxybutyrate depolymerase
VLRRLALIAALVASGTCTSSRAASTAAASKSGSCSSATGHDPGETTQTIRSSGRDRSYVLYVPPGYTGHRRVPAVFNWHGYGQSAQAQLTYSGFEQVADREGFLIVAPEGQGTPPHFNLTTTPPPGETDDVLFAEDVLHDVQRHLCIDDKRVFTTGLSNGGAMSAVLACRASRLFAAFGSVAAVVWAPVCDSARSLPLMAFHGTADPVVPFDGGTVTCCGNPHIDAVADTMRNWATHDTCMAAPTDTRVAPHIVHRVWAACRPPGGVELYIVEGGGHAWPGASISVSGSTNEIDATSLLWEFFKQHPLP